MKFLISFSLLIVLLLLGAGQSVAQYSDDSKRDFSWVLGNKYNPLYQFGMVLSFQNQTFSADSFQMDINLGWANASISDTNGNLLFFTNGMSIADRYGHVMPHGDSISYGSGYFYQNYQSFGYPLLQGCLILPLPMSNSKYIVLHGQYPDNSIIVTKMLYSVVDMDLNNGFGDVVQKNQILVEDTLTVGGFTAVKHANNRDWWILIPTVGDSSYYTYLLYPEGFLFEGIQSIGLTKPLYCTVATFSPDGTKYAIIAEENHSNTPSPPFLIHAGVFNFDRNTGLLSNYRNINFNSNNYPILGFKFSPNSKYLYAGAADKLLQWDTETSDISTSCKIVAELDGFSWPYPNCPLFFGSAALAPDGLIYFIGGASGPYLHVINNPDVEGINCNVTQHSVELPSYAILSLPNFPNFRLGAPIGIGENNSIVKKNISAYPNPARDHIQFSVDITNNYNPMQFEIVNTLGQTISSEYFAPFQNVVNYNVSSLQPGVFLAILKDKSVIRGSVKFVVE